MCFSVTSHSSDMTTEEHLKHIIHCEILTRHKHVNTILCKHLGKLSPAVDSDNSDDSSSSLSLNEKTVILSTHFSN